MICVTVYSVVLEYVKLHYFGHICPQTVVDVLA